MNNSIKNSLEWLESKYSIIFPASLSIQDAEILSSESEIDEHLNTRPAQWFLDHCKTYDSIAVYDWSKIIWFISMDTYDMCYKWVHIYETIALRVDKSYRDQGLWKYLMKKIREHYSKYHIASLSNNPKVVNILEKHLSYDKLDHIDKSLKEILELWWPIDWHWYSVFANQALFELIKQ